MRAFATLAPLLLAACQTTASAPEEFTCNPDGFVGSNYAAISFPAGKPVRAIRPGDMITMDYRANRLNLELDESGTVTRAYCG